MQTLDIISINFWNILISLVNLLILFLLVKKFLFKPIKRIMARRQEEVNKEYAEAEKARAAAEENQALWEEKMTTADEEADSIVKAAVEEAKVKGNRIVAASQNRAAEIIHHAELEADVERKRVEKEVKAEIVDVSTKLTEKMLEREINAEDHRRMIDSFIDELGD